MDPDFTRMDTDLKFFADGPGVGDTNASVFIRG